MQKRGQGLIGYWQELYHLFKNPQPTNLDVSNLHKLEKDGCARPCLEVLPKFKKFETGESWGLAWWKATWNGTAPTAGISTAFMNFWENIFFQPKLLIGELYYVYYMEFLWQHKFCWNAQTFEGKLGESFRFHSSYSFAPIFQLLTHIYCYKL